jgi:hypothetical protein
MSEKPLSPHLMASAGFGTTSPRITAAVTPINPTAAGGNGSSTSATMTPEKRPR